jgi:hypothetical protein
MAAIQYRNDGGRLWLPVASGPLYCSSHDHRYRTMLRNMLGDPPRQLVETA